jgi:hypothetical protein
MQDSGDAAYLTIPDLTPEAAWKVDLLPSDHEFVAHSGIVNAQYRYDGAAVP